jgi:hypothetical protein
LSVVPIITGGAPAEKEFFVMRMPVGRALTALFLLSLSAHAERLPDAAIAARASIAIEQPNILPTQALGLGNGRLGAAFWAAQGLTLQLNRADTLPYRRSSGRVILPDLQALTADRRFRGVLKLEDGVLRETGGGIVLEAWVEHDTDRVILEVKGLAPEVPQHIRLELWEPREPAALAQGDMALLAETWRDDQLPGASGRQFGSLAAIRAFGRNARARVIDKRTVEVTVLPTADGYLRVVIAAPAYDGGRTAVQVASDAFVPEISLQTTVDWWHAFWARVQPVRAESRDGIARYAETLRTLFLFASAAHNGGNIPGSQAGLADLFSSSKDDHFWDPGAFWFWNLRMQVAANLGAGVPQLNAPVFALYRDNLDAILRWTQKHMGGRSGACIPETMRFNGNGVEFENDRFRPFAIITHSCDQDWSASSNARTLTSGAEIGLWVWRTYLQTNDRAFLETNYPLMVEPARFLLGYQAAGKDALLHTTPSNAHETQMDVTDPTTDLAAIRALYPAVVEASTLLARDAELARQLSAALKNTPELPVANASAVAAPSLASRTGDKVLAASYMPASAYVNGENIGLEPVWPYGLIGIDDPLFATARRTYELRPFVHAATWSNDPIQAAWLGMGSEVSRAIFQLVQLYQVYPNGMSALLADPPQEFYLEQAGVVATALTQALAVQESSGLIRVAPAIPPGWTIAGTVPLHANMLIDVEAIDGRLSAFSFRVANRSPLRFQTPWKSRAQIIEDGKPLSVVTGDRFTVTPREGKLYHVAPVGSSAAFPPFVVEPTPTVKVLGRAAIGLGPPCCAPPAGYNVRSDE